jgi:hypothetical protein
MTGALSEGCRLAVKRENLRYMDEPGGLANLREAAGDPAKLGS